MGKLIYMFEARLAAHERHKSEGCKIWHSCCANFGCPRCHPYLVGFDKAIPNGDRDSKEIRDETI